MKKLFVCFAVLMILANSLFAVNLVLNPSFELDADTNSRPDDWGNDTDYSRSADTANSGTYSAKGQGNGGIGTISQTITLTPDTDYNLSVSIYYASGSGVVAFDTTDKFDLAYGTQTTLYGPNGDWTTYTNRFNSGAETSVQLRTYTSNLTNGVFYVDDVLLEEVVPEGLIQHLDATVTASVTGSPVTEWADQSGAGNDAVPANGSVTYPSVSLSATGLPGLDFGSADNSLELFSAADSDSWLDFDGAASNNTGFAVLLAFKCDTVVSNWNDLIGNTSGISSGFGMRYGDAGQIVAYLGGAVVQRTSPVIEAGDSVVFAINYDAVAGEYTFWDSVNRSEITASVAATNFSEAAAVTLGRTTSGTRYFDGMVGEVQIYTSVLSAGEFQAEYDALVEKWVDIDTSLVVSTIFQDYMVLQRDMNVPIWGTAAPGSNVVVKLDGNIVDTVTADVTGKWMAYLGFHANDGGTAHTVEVLSDGQPTVTFSDVVFGDVYLVSGQSNMDRTMSIVWNSAAEEAAADYPLIRAVQIQNDTASTTPYENAVFARDWRECSPSTVATFSAAAYFFARSLYLETGVPIGLLRASRGARQIMHFIAPEGVAAIPELAALRQQIKDGPEPSNSNGVYYDLYNPMIAPLVPYGICGFVWYQCEWDTQSDENRQMYHQKMRALMAGWRDVWGLGDLPFYYVQLPTWENGGIAAQTRQSQLWALSETNSGMIVTIDIGAFPELETNPGVYDNPLHPGNKQDVGARLARWARRDIYNESIVPSGPIYTGMTIEGSQIRVFFDYADGLFAGTKFTTNAVVPSASPLDNFEIAGADGTYYAATATIDGSTMVVSSPSVPSPVNVRYCYADWPDEYNVKLYNSDSLPASPFYTDLEYGLIVINGSGDGWYDEGEGVSIVADSPGTGKVFDRWVGLPSGIANPTASSTTVTMPAHQTYLMATYRDSGESTYTLTVNQGEGGGSSKAGSYLAIEADAPQQGYSFAGWTGDTQAVHDVSSPYTTVTMPAANTAVTATYVLENGMSYTEWAATNGITGGPLDDDDGDGLDNLSEYAIFEKPVVTKQGESFEYIYKQRSDDPNLSYELQTCSDLVIGSWTNTGYTVTGINVSGAYNEVTNSIPTTGPQNYIRLKITNQ